MRVRFHMASEISRIIERWSEHKFYMENMKQYFAQDASELFRMAHYWICHVDSFKIGKSSIDMYNCKWTFFLWYP